MYVTGNVSEELFSADDVSAFPFYFNKYGTVLLLSECESLKPVLQNGLECGIVALSMATQLLSESPVLPSTILHEARTMGFTLQGEMFSADHMAVLAERVCHCKARIMTNLEDHKMEIISHILAGYPILFPYDAGYNHVPCKFSGQAAHWSTVVGIGLVIPRHNFKIDTLGTDIRFCKNSFLSKYVDKSSPILVCALQGKSKKLAIWNLDELLESNGNLKELAAKHDPATMVLPQGGDVLGGLRDKAVLLMPKSQKVRNLGFWKAVLPSVLFSSIEIKWQMYVMKEKSLKVWFGVMGPYSSPSQL